MSLRLCYSLRLEYCPVYLQACLIAPNDDLKGDMKAGSCWSNDADRHFHWRLSTLALHWNFADLLLCDPFLVACAFDEQFLDGLVEICNAIANLTWPTCFAAASLFANGNLGQSPNPGLQNQPQVLLHLRETASFVDEYRLLPRQFSPFWASTGFDWPCLGGPWFRILRF